MPRLERLSVATLVLIGLALVPAHAQTLFFDDFTGPTLSPIYQPALSDAGFGIHLSAVPFCHGDGRLVCF